MNRFHILRPGKTLRVLTTTGIAVIATVFPVLAQVPNAPLPPPEAAPPGSPADKGGSMESMPGMIMGDPMMTMSSSVDLLSPMTQESSGTAWLPASTPMYGKMFMHPDGSMLMLHGAITPRYVYAGSRRGDGGFGSPNWFMGMYQRPLGAKDQIGFRAMISFDPLTEGGSGYPLLFQTGESWHGQPLHDRQHPHDLFSELSVSYSHLLAANTSGYLYLGYPGEPALGPPTFMHRLIAFDLPDAPIGHHWQDATHITFGVATAGVNFGNRFKVEGSVFNGREPNENRYDFDTVRFDSHSGRVFFNSDSRNSFQVAYGFQKNPEGDNVNQHRTTASWVYNKPLGADANFTSTFSWGQNILANAEGRSNSFLAEADYQRERHTYFTRLENIQKSGHELVLPEALHENKYALGAYTVGYMYDLTHGNGVDTGIGATITVNTKPSALDPFYGSDSTPTGFQILFRLRPSRMRMGNGNKMTGMNHEAMLPGGHTGRMPSEEGQDMPMPPATPSPVKPMPTPAPVPPVSPPDDPTAPLPPTATVAIATLPNPPKAWQKTRVTVSVTGSDGKPLRGASVKASATMTTMDMGVLKPIFKETGEGKYEADVTFSMPGPWRLAIVLTPRQGKAVQKTVEYAVVR